MKIKFYHEMLWSAPITNEQNMNKLHVATSWKCKQLSILQVFNHKFMLTCITNNQHTLWKIQIKIELTNVKVSMKWHPAKLLCLFIYDNL